MVNKKLINDHHEDIRQRVTNFYANNISSNTYFYLTTFASTRCYLL
ncbi:hypothetical protein BS78_06G029200 [Paspalum vaginatum]|nr:hypothetical protein BS78_06G029200 [Paspalum vaginatum]